MENCNNKKIFGNMNIGIKFFERHLGFAVSD
jgi:hypothetical protein